MRLGMFRLQGIIAEQLSQPMVKGSFFLFINKPHTLLKAVWFDGTGLCLFCKRLEQGQYSWPLSATINEEKRLQIQPSALALLRMHSTKIEASSYPCSCA